MAKLNFKIKNVKLAFALLLIIAFAVFIAYYILVFSPLSNKINFANQMIELTDENENTFFSVQKISIFNSATAVDNSDNLSLENISVSQYTDLSISLDNSQYSSEISPETTIKELYIDNISITPASNKGTQILNYKNPLNFGKFVDLSVPNNGRIDFKIINKNDENENTNYDEPTFYTDCSNPISLGFVNKNILANFSASDDANVISFNNAKVLGNTGINLEDINYSLSFTIHIVNNSNMKFAYNMALDVKLSDDSELFANNGSSYKTLNTSGSEYRFFKEVD